MCGQQPSKGPPALFEVRKGGCPVLSMCVSAWRDKPPVRCGNADGCCLCFERHTLFDQTAKQSQSSMAVEICRQSNKRSSSDWSETCVTQRLVNNFCGQPGRQDTSQEKGQQSSVGQKQGRIYCRFRELSTAVFLQPNPLGHRLMSATFWSVQPLVLTLSRNGSARLPLYLCSAGSSAHHGLQALG